MKVGFRVVLRPTGVELETFEPEGHPLPVVSFARQEGDFAVLAGRIYYQAELRKQIARHGYCPGADRNEAALALAAFRAMGLKGVEGLEGDFSLVLWDARHSSLIGARDPHGGYPLFWTEAPALRAFSTSLSPLLAVRPRRVLSLDYCADFLMMPAPRNEGSGESCAYEGIQRVLPGSLVTLCLANETATRRTYWSWSEHVADPGTGDLGELAQRYAETLRTAVHERIRGKSLAHLSGGMDSTSVALIAGELAHSGQIEPPVHALSLLFGRVPDLDRERPFIEESLRTARGLVAHRVDVGTIREFDGFLDPPDLEEPYIGLGRVALDRVSLDRAAHLGASTVLTGLGADEIHHALPHHLADLLRQRRWWHAWAEATKWARHYNCSPWVLLRQYGGLPNTALWRTHRRFKDWLSRGPGQLSAQDDWTTPPWVVPEFAERYALQARAMENARRTYGLHELNVVSEALRGVMSRSGDPLRWSVAAPLGVAYSHPFFDARVLSLGLGILAKIPPEPGLMKPILAAAMRHVLPASVRTRRSKVGANALYYAGLSRHMADLEAMIRRAPAVTWEMFDRATLLDSLHEASLAGTGVRKLQRLNYTLCLIHWLGMQEDARPSKEDVATERFKLDLEA